MNVMTDYKTIAESKNFIVLDQYTKEWPVNESYQSESELERELVQDLINQGYEFVPGLNNPEALLANVRVQLQVLNNVQFLDAEWLRFVESWLDKPSDGIVEKTRKIHDDYIHDFVFDDGRIQNIYLLDKKNIARNKLQVIKQFEQTGKHANRYDVSILVNGLPLVQVELKKRGVAMFLTGFDAPTLNTLFVDKNLRYHGLMQAYSRTNRIYDATKTFGNIVTFRDLEQATIDAITLFGDKNTKNVVLEKSYKEYMEGFTDVVTGEARRGFVEVVKELEQRFPDPSAIEKESDKKAFAKLFGEYLRIEHVLQNYDEFAGLKALQNIDMSDPVAVEVFKAKHYLSDEDLAALQSVKIPADRKVQDYRSAYNDIRDWLRREKSGKEQEESNIDWDDVVFEVDLLKSQEINLDFILELIFDNNKKVKDKVALVEDVRRLIRSSLGNRAKESLLVDFINQSDLDKMGDKAGVIEAFFAFAQAEQQREAQELISSESLNAEAAKRYITNSLKREYASDNGTELNAILPKMSPLNPQYLTKKQSVFQKIAAFVEKFKGVGGQV
ncbi:MAG: Type site-specific deoxyribonuclease, HsdR family [Pseudomonadota bacterium]|jgi:type I site-specific restriction-modification system R (restriction) subunit